MNFHKISPAKGFTIFDDVLSPQDHQRVWRYLQEERWEFVHQKRWIKEFRLGDGQPLWGPTYLSDPVEGDETTPFYPTGTAIDLVIESVKEKARSCEGVIGAYPQDWAYFFVRPYLYPVGTGLSWHAHEREKTPGAFIYYAHPLWNTQWGGELLLASPKAHKHETLLEEGCGTYIMPRPNRLVMLASGAFHCIKKVDAAAGDHARTSVQGFFHPRKEGVCAHKHPA